MIRHNISSHIPLVIGFLLLIIPAYSQQQEIRLGIEPFRSEDRKADSSEDVTAEKPRVAEKMGAYIAEQLAKQNLVIVKNQDVSSVCNNVDYCLEGTYLVTFGTCRLETRLKSRSGKVVAQFLDVLVLEDQTSVNSDLEALSRKISQRVNNLEYAEPIRVAVACFLTATPDLSNPNLLGRILRRESQGGQISETLYLSITDYLEQPFEILDFDDFPGETLCKNGKNEQELIGSAKIKDANLLVQGRLDRNSEGLVMTLNIIELTDTPTIIPLNKRMLSEDTYLFEIEEAVEELTTRLKSFLDENDRWVSKAIEISGKVNLIEELKKAEAAKDYDLAHIYADQLLMSKPDNAYALWKKGTLFLEEGKYVLANETLLRIPPDERDNDIWMSLARSWLRVENSGEASSGFERAFETALSTRQGPLISFEPSTASKSALTARLHDNWDKATGADHLWRAIQASENLAEVEWNRRQFEAAARAMWQTIALYEIVVNEIDESYKKLLIEKCFELIMIQMDNNSFESAMETIDFALKYDPNNKQIKDYKAAMAFDLANRMKAEGQIDAARSKYQLAWGAAGSESPFLKISAGINLLPEENGSIFYDEISGEIHRILMQPTLTSEERSRTMLMQREVQYLRGWYTALSREDDLSPPAPDPEFQSIAQLVKLLAMEASNSRVESECGNDQDCLSRRLAIEPEKERFYKIIEQYTPDSVMGPYDLSRLQNSVEEIPPGERRDRMSKYIKKMQAVQKEQK